MTDQDAYRRYTAEAERLAKLAEVPGFITLPANATLEEAQEASTKLEALGFSRDLVLIPADVQISDHLVQLAQVWATLALAAAQERVQPADRPTDTPSPEHAPGQVRDGDGDLWTIAKDGRYRIGDVIQDTGERSLEEIATFFNGYTEVT